LIDNLIIRDSLNISIINISY